MSTLDSELPQADLARSASLKHPPLEPDGWLERTLEGRPETEQKALQAAVALASRAHAGQVRASGEPYISHVLAVADILNDLRMDHETLVAAILHDVVEDTDISLADVERDFGPVIARLVDGVTKMGRISGTRSDGHSPREQAQAESLRKLLLATVEDVRVVLIKLADRLHNMRTLRYLDPERQRRIALETRDIYAPLANRLGVWHLKWELEDLSLRYLEPETYQSIARLLDERRVDREQFINQVIGKIRHEVDALGINAEVTGRPKHIYSIWNKMERKNIDFHQVFDVRAVRVLVDKVADCYAVLGVVHSLWHHIPREFDDYIANPKENLYRSLHTAVVGPDGRTLEVQIRTHEMHQHAEMGVAAHWRYKEGAHFDAGFENKISWLRQLLDWKDDDNSASDFVDRFKSETDEDRVYVLTPQGKVMDLPYGATPLDFAYYIHTDVGHRCRGAKVNGRIVPLTYLLRSGDQVEVLTTKNGTPSRDWLNSNLGYLKSPRTRAKVRAWFKQQDQEKNISAGRTSIDRELHRLGVRDLSLESLAQRFHFSQVDELLAAVGAGDVSTAQIAGAVQELTRPDDPPPLAPRRVPQHTGPRESGGGFRIHGVGNLLTQLARCCSPVPHDPIIGYITRGRGVTIHRRDCANILRLDCDDKERLIEVNWEGGAEKTYPVDIHVMAYDRSGLLRDISAVLANDKVNVMGVNTYTDPDDRIAHMGLTLEIADISQLSRVLDRISQLPNVLEARRKV